VGGRGWGVSGGEGKCRVRGGWEWPEGFLRSGIWGNRGGGLGRGRVREEVGGGGKRGVSGGEWKVGRSGGEVCTCEVRGYGRRIMDGGEGGGMGGRWRVGESVGGVR